jgi:plasmid stabilization system protein ParE
MYQIEITQQARDDADAVYDWMYEHISATFAEKWYRELFKQIETLTRLPARCPVARESKNFPEEIRELVYGKQRHKHKYRVLFAIRGQTVAILYVHHSSRDDING